MVSEDDCLLLSQALALTLPFGLARGPPVTERSQLLALRALGQLRAAAAGVIGAAVALPAPAVPVRNVLTRVVVSCQEERS